MKIPLSEFPYGNYASGNWKTEGDRMLPVESPDEIVVVVAGGAEGAHGLCFIPFGGGWFSHARVQ